MKHVWTVVFALIFPLALSATEIVDEADMLENTAGEVEAEALPNPDEELLFLDAREVNVREFIWERRLVVVMANTPDDPQFTRQLEALREREEEFVARDAVVIFDAHPEDRSPLRQVLRPRSFMTAIIDKDGEVKARRPAVRTSRELIAVIDRFPTRRQEILERLPSGR